MPTPPWADLPRRTFLIENLSGYTAAQERNGTTEFIGGLHERYFAKFPEPDEELMALERKVSEPQYMNSFVLLTSLIAR